MTVQALATEIKADRHDPVNTADSPSGMQAAMAAAAEGWLELVDDTDLGA